MKRAMLVAAFVIAGSLPGLAQEPSASAGDPQQQQTTDVKKTADAPKPAPEEAPVPPKPSATGEVTLGALQNDVDTLSSKFTEYRDVPDGVVAPVFKLRGDFRGMIYDARGENVRQHDQRYRLYAWKNTWRFDADYNQIPHRFGNAGRTLLQQSDPNHWQVSDTLQQTFENAIASAPRTAITYPFLRDLVTPSLAAGNTVDLALQRERGSYALRVNPNDNLDVRVSYFHERRVGDRAASGTSFGFGNVVELAEPVHYLTQDLGADAEYHANWGNARAGVHFNWFNNRLETLSFDNPFRATDATDPSAYTAPASGSIGGPARGLTSLPPDNDAVRGTVGATVKLPGKTRLSADVAVGRWTQNSTPFIPFSTNTAIVTPVRATDPSALPARRLDGKVDVVNLSASVTSRPANKLTLRARFLNYDQDNKTPRIEFPLGYVRFDAVWEDIPRISVPYGFTTRRFDATAAYDLGRLTLEGGYRRSGFDRTFRETERTTENALTLAANVRASDWAILRASYERGKRDFDRIDPERSEEASFLEPEPPANMFALPGYVRFDQAKRDTDRIGANLQVSPGSGKVSVGVGYYRTNEDYKETGLGLQNASYDEVSVDLDYTPSARWTVYGFYSFEKIGNFQRGRQSGATPSTNPLDDWTSNVDDKAHSLGAGAEVTLVPDKWFLSLSGRFQKVDGFNDLFAAPGGAPFQARVAFGGPQDLTRYDDTRIATLGSELRRQVGRWSAALGGWFEDYDVDDSNSENLGNYVPGSFFLAANDANYRALVGYLRLSYRW
jgi:MtrB/PioB family decaheme-associated outer membrane protein